MTTKPSSLLLFAIGFFAISLPAQSGLQGEYFNGQNFEQKVMTRTDAQINFVWDNVAPATGIHPNVFSVRWTGKLKAPETGSYLFRAHVDDGIRVKLNGQMVINAWGMHDSQRFTGEIYLHANQEYNLEVEYFNALFEGEIQLFWQLPSEAPVFKGLLGYNDHPIEPRYLSLPKTGVELPINMLPPPAKPSPTTPPKTAPKPTPARTKPAPRTDKPAVIAKDTLEKYIPKNILFEKSKSIMLAASAPELDRLAGFLLRNPKYKLHIEGHTDHIGNAAKNQTLSDQRAETVANYLIGKGIDSQRITSKGYGDTRPLVREAAGVPNEKNRRVEFLIH